MKLKIMAAFLLIVSVFCMSGCSIGTKRLVNDINANATWELNLLTPEEEMHFSDSGYGIVPGFGITGYYDKKYGEGNMETGELPSTYVLYSVTSYPDAMSKKKCITRIDVQDPNIDIFGFSIGDSSQAFGELLREKGFQPYKDYNEDMDRFKKGKVIIYFGIDHEMQTISNGITVMVDTTNYFGIVF
jgi:hypothetical protein